MNLPHLPFPRAALLWALAATVAAAAPVAVPDAATLHRGQKVRVAVLANDTGSPDPTTVSIGTPPQHGTAAVDSAGRVLYTHTADSQAGDSFTYTVANGSGVSAPATVTISLADSLRIPVAAPNLPANPPPTLTVFTPVVTGLVNPVCIASPPGETRRVFICEKIGRIRVAADLAVSGATTTFLDLAAVVRARGETFADLNEQGLLGLAFHPAYASNRYFYVYYSVRKAGVGLFQRVSRFTARNDNPNAADPASEFMLFEQSDLAENHNGGDLHFGPDGCLYISVGDGGSGDDALGLSQKIDDGFHAGLLRIDVDKRPGSREPAPHPGVPLDGGLARYAIPADNPFVNATSFLGRAIDTTKRREEFWAVGLRNPWRFSFDSATGEIWLADVGQSAWEEVNLIEKGGNYGWAFREGTRPGARANEAPAGFEAQHRAPLWEYSHRAADPSFRGSIGHRWTRLSRRAFPRVCRRLYLCRLWFRQCVVARPRWCESADGAPDRRAGEHRGLWYRPGQWRSAGGRCQWPRPAHHLPAHGREPLSRDAQRDGLFADLTDLAPAPGLIPYRVNLPFWSDHAVKRRWFTLPGGSAKMTWRRDDPWSFPAGQIWVKHFELETTRGRAVPRKRLETRVLVRNSSGVYGVSYRWNDEGTEATLVGQ